MPSWTIWSFSTGCEELDEPPALAVPVVLALEDDDPHAIDIVSATTLIPLSNGVMAAL
jgi:hypothetical protein